MNKAPSFFLTAVGAARVIGGPPGPMTPLLLVFHGHAGAEAAFSINAIVRASFPDIAQVQIASIVDLRHIPRYMRSAVELTLSAAYRNAAKRIPQDRDPTEYVMIAADWEGKVTNAFGMEERTNDIGLVLITPPWQIFDVYNGSEPYANVVAMVASASNDLSRPTIDPTATS